MAALAGDDILALVKGLASESMTEQQEDAAHSQMGIELVSSFTDQTMSASKRVISDIFRIMHLVLDDFVALGREREARA